MDSAVYVVEKAAGSDRAYVVNTVTSARIARFNIFKRYGKHPDGWTAARAYAERLNQERKSP